jgi:Leucine-rich repeat (LRR) protein
MWLTRHLLRIAAVAGTMVFILTGCSKNSTGDDVSDGTAPSIVTDLSVSGVTATSVSLTWTASGDDGSSGRASRYDLRYWDHEIDWSNFDSALQATGEPSPSTAGQTETATVSGLKTDSIYYFALKVFDEAGNYPGVSNCVTATCFADHVVVFPDDGLEGAVRAEIGLLSGDIYRSALMSMTDLNAYNLGIVDLSGLEQCTSLDYLDLGDNAITDLDSLASLTTLTRLYLSRNQVTDLSPISGLPILEVLSVSGNNISDISCLVGMSTLLEIDLRNNNITDIGPLVTNTNLDTGVVVWLTANPLNLQSVEEHIPALRARGVIVNWWPDVQPPTTVADLTIDSTGATWVTLSWTAPSDNSIDTRAYGYDLRYSTDSATAAAWTTATPVNGLPAPDLPGTAQSVRIEDLTTETTYFLAIKSRDIYGNWSGRSNVVKAKLFENIAVAIPDDSLEMVLREKLNRPAGDFYRTDLDTIIELRAQDRGIQDLTGLEYCESLQVLDLMSNQISDLDPLDSLFSLMQLQLDGNVVDDLSPLTALTGLQTLQISRNPITNLAPVASLTELWYLEAMDIDAVDFTPLSSLSDLRYLFVESNNLTDISFLAECHQLTYLYLDLNAISDLEPLSGLTQLQTLSMRYNQISDLSPLVNNSGIGSGDAINLQNNPLSQQSLDEHIPALQARGVTVSY